MTERKPIFKNAGWKAAATIGAKLLMFAMLALAGRMAPVSQFGHLIFGLAACQILFTLMDFGVATALARQASKSPAKSDGWIFSAFKLRSYLLVLGIIGFLLILKYVQLPESARWLLLVLGLTSATDSVGRIFSSIYIAAEDLRSDGIALLAGRIVFFAFGWLMLAKTGLILWVGVAHLIGNLVTVRMLMKNMPLLATPAYKAGHPAGTTSLLWQVAWPLGLTELFTVIYFRIDQVMLEKWAGPEQVGYYGAAFRMTEAAMILPASILAAAFPGFVRAAGEGKKLKADAAKIGSFLFGIALVGAGFGFLWAEPLCVLLFGKSFSLSAPFLKILMLALVLIYPNYLFTQLLVAAGMQRRFLSIAMVCAVFNVAANLYAIPRFGAAGAAWVTVGTELILCIGARLSLRKKLGPPGLQNLGLGLLLGFVTFGSGWVLGYLLPMPIGMASHLVLCALFFWGAMKQFQADRAAR